MNINAIDELNRELDDLKAKIKQLEKSPNRTFVLIEYETLSSFHYFNLCFKQFWDEFDRHSASQLLLLHKFVNIHSELSDRYVSLFREQIDYLEEVIDFKGECVKELPPVLLSEDNKTDVIGHYKDCFKDYTDEEGKPLYEIDLDRDTCSEVVNGKTVPIDFYMFRSDKLNAVHYKGLLGIYNCLDSIFDLMCVICSYPTELLSGYKPTQKDIIFALENELRQYTKEVSINVERDLRKKAQNLKPSRNSSLTSDVWGKVMEEEDKLFDLAISDSFGENTETLFENISATKDQLVENFSLLQKIKTTCLDEELFDIRLAVETHQLLSSLNADNLDLFYELVLRRNIIQREMFPEELRAKYDEWLNPSEELKPEDDEGTELSAGRQSKLDEIIGILKNGKWKEPATPDNIELLLNAVFGKDVSSLEESDIAKCKDMWSFVEGGGGERMLVVPANFAGFFLEENLLSGTPKQISNDLFGKNNNQSNNINKGKSDYSSITFNEIRPFLKKYTDKIIRQL